MIIVIFYHNLISKFDVPACYFPERQKVKYLAVKQWVSSVIVRVTPYVVILFWQPLVLAFLFQLLISLN